MELSDKHIVCLILGGTMLILALLVMMVYILLQNSRKLNHNYMEQKAMQAEMQRELVGEAERVMEEISRELHDNIGQVMSTLRLKLQRMEKLEGDSVKGERIAEALELTESAITETEQIARYLSRDFILTRALNVELQALLERMCRHNSIEVDMSVAGDVQKLPQQAKLLVIRIAQEAFHNIQKHSDATEAHLLLQYGASSFLMSIRDNGTGINHETARVGLGFRNMQSRAGMLGGTLHLESFPGGGFAVTLVVPQIEFQAATALKDKTQQSCPGSY